jgi:hypothetical protein
MNNVQKVQKISITYYYVMILPCSLVISTHALFPLCLWNIHS